MGLSTCSWIEAHDYCFDLDLGGYQDWRLPSVIELVSLVDYSQPPPGPTLDPTVFLGEPGEPFWSASCYAEICPADGVPGASSAWVVGFDYGSVGYDEVENYYRVRCVR
jgi:hypothetical protein